MADLTNVVLTGAQSTINSTLDGNVDILHAHHNDTSAPSSPVKGGIYLVNDQWRWYDGSVLQYAGIGKWEANWDGNGKQLLDFLLEKLATGSLPSPSAANEGRPWWDETLERAGISGSTTKRYFAECETDGSTFVRIDADLNVTTLGTPATANTSTSRGGWELNAAAEELNIIARRPIPDGYANVPAAGKDLILCVEVLLLNAETANDDIDMDGVAEVLRDGDAPGDDEQALVAVTLDIGSNNGQYDRHVVELAIPYDGFAGNDAAAGDTLTARINHDATGEVAGVIVVGAWFKVPVLNFDG